MPIDIVQHLQNRNYPRAIQLKRVVWGLLTPLFAWSPTPLYGWRNFLLRLLGANLGQGVRIHPSVRIMFPWNLHFADQVIVGRDVNLYALASIRIHSHVLISQGAHLCAGSHDYRHVNFPIAHAPIEIHSGTWIAADAFIGPGLVVGAGAVVGARAVVSRDVPPATVVVGNPARVIKHLTV